MEDEDPFERPEVILEERLSNLEATLSAENLSRISDLADRIYLSFLERSFNEDQSSKLTDLVLMHALDGFV